VKAQTASMVYRHQGKIYLLNLVDTPGHVDFSYEVSRSLAASQGALLLVDASQGIQAQTVANFFLAFENDLQVIPVLNKVGFLPMESFGSRSRSGSSSASGSHFSSLLTCFRLIFPLPILKVQQSKSI